MLVLMALPDQCDLRKHMRWAMAEVIGSLGANARPITCQQGRLAESLDAVLDWSLAEPYGVAVVAGARLFMALVVSLRPAVRPTRFVVFLGAHDADDAVPPLVPPPSPPPVPATHRRWRWGSGCGCRARTTMLPPPPMPVAALVPSDPRPSVLVIDTTNGDARVQPWIDCVQTTMGSVFRWRSGLAGGESSAARDGARILDFVRNQ